MHAHPSSIHLHHKVNTIGSGHAAEDKSFLPTVAELLRFCRDILIVGPGTEKAALLHYLQVNRKDLTATNYMRRPATIRPTARLSRLAGAALASTESGMI